MKFSQNTDMMVEYVLFEKGSMYSVTGALKANFLLFQKLFKSNQGNNWTLKALVELYPGSRLNMQMLKSCAHYFL